MKNSTTTTIFIGILVCVAVLAVFDLHDRNESSPAASLAGGFESPRQSATPPPATSGAPAAFNEATVATPTEASSTSGIPTPGAQTGSATFANPAGFFSIQYPESLGPLVVSYPGPDGDTSLNWPSQYTKPYSLDVFLVNTEGLSLEDWFSKNEMPTSTAEAVTIDGLPGMILITMDGRTNTYLQQIIGGVYYIQDIEFQCPGRGGGSEGYTCLPPFWRSITNSFKVFPEGTFLLNSCIPMIATTSDFVSAP